MREAVAMALQRVGDRNMDQLISAMWDWSQGTLLEKRAGAAALCEPRLLVQANHTREVLKILESILSSMDPEWVRKMLISFEVNL
jgi:hypothetical protein